MRQTTLKYVLQYLIIDPACVYTYSMVVYYIQIHNRNLCIYRACIYENRRSILFTLRTILRKTDGFCPNNFHSLGRPLPMLSFWIRYASHLLLHHMILKPYIHVTFLFSNVSTIQNYLTCIDRQNDSIDSKTKAVCGQSGHVSPYAYGGSHNFSQETD